MWFSNRNPTNDPNVVILRLGGKVVVPDSKISTEEGRIIAVSPDAITVEYFTEKNVAGTNVRSKFEAIYSFDILNHWYGDMKHKPITPDKVPF